MTRGVFRVRLFGGRSLGELVFAFWLVAAFAVLAGSVGAAA